MSQSLVKNYLHLVYSTKSRRRWIHAECRDRLYAYQAGILKDYRSPAVIIGGVEDHVHTLLLLSKNQALKDVVEVIKKRSSKWMKLEASNGLFRWQAGYAAFSVSESQVEHVAQYIKDQPEHHRRISFQDELRALFIKIVFDERYVWD